MSARSLKKTGLQKNGRAALGDSGNPFTWWLGYSNQVLGSTGHHSGDVEILTCKKGLYRFEAGKLFPQRARSCIFGFRLQPHNSAIVI